MWGLDFTMDEGWRIFVVIRCHTNKIEQENRGGSVRGWDRDRALSC